jgi:crossover junction endodeoxyribonuclease RuvC
MPPDCELAVIVPLQSPTSGDCIIEHPVTISAQESADSENKDVKRIRILYSSAYTDTRKRLLVAFYFVGYYSPCYFAGARYDGIVIVLGLDPGTATTGFGVVRYEDGKLSPLDVGVLLTTPDMPMEERLLSIYTDVNTLLDRYQPDTVATERLFFNNNVTNALSVGRAIGVMVLAFAQRKLPWAEYTPMQVKQAVTGYGGAEKHQVQAQVTRLLGLSEIPKPDDAADGLAVAICHAHSYRLGSVQFYSRRGSKR